MEKQNIGSTIYISTDSDIRHQWEEFRATFKEGCATEKTETSGFVKDYLAFILKDEHLCILDESYYRARVNKIGEVFTNDDLKAPPPNKARAGRLNAEGVSYLYISTKKDTAKLEVGSKGYGNDVTIAVCKPTECLKILDLTKEDDSEVYHNFRRSISTSFSKKLSSQDDVGEYIYTQYIADRIKDAGFDGVQYKSAVDDKGKNLCIFSPDTFMVEIVEE